MLCPFEKRQNKATLISDEERKRALGSEMEKKKEKHLRVSEPKSGRQNTSVNAAQLSHIKKSVLGPEAFDRLISARIPEEPGCCSCSNSAPWVFGTEGGKLWPENKLFYSQGTKAQPSILL